jgi:hypothetical protein
MDSELKVMLGICPLCNTENTDMRRLEDGKMYFMCEESPCETKIVMKLGGKYI